MPRTTTDTGWLIRETIKGLPEAGKKVGGAIGKGVGAVMKGAAQGISAAGRLARKAGEVAKRQKPRRGLSPEEMEKRRKILDRYREIIKRYKEKNPNFKVPRQFRDLE